MVTLRVWLRRMVASPLGAMPVGAGLQRSRVPVDVPFAYPGRTVVVRGYPERYRGGTVIVRCRAVSPSSALAVMSEVAEVLDDRTSTGRASVTTAVSDRVALGIADMFRSPTPSGRVLEKFATTGAADCTQLIDAARVEQGYASAEGHAALYCLIGWVHKQRHRAATR